jgi:PHD/YefM family antitoxin component YafN of YafNO toxin-antitoxin module
VIIKVEKYPEVDDDVILMKHNNPEVIIIDKEPVEETKETEVNDDALMKHIVNNLR